ncbi:MAG TPA: DUF2383 domain-containing protein [Steroidobacteraceae bacterium]|nr:DUF2383 domain-containing protein [Steroidobacteraceae bacterium]
MDSEPIDTSNEVRLLNSLIVSTLDNVDEYRRAVFLAEQQLAALQRRIFVRTHAVERMQRHVRALGAQPAANRSCLASAFASLLSERLLIREQDQEQLLLDATRGEQRLKRQFEASRNAPILSEATRTIVDGVHQTIVAERVDSDTDRADSDDQSWGVTLPPSVAAPSMHVVSMSG